MEELKLKTSKPCKNPIMSVSIDFIHNYSLKNFDFYSICQHILSFWHYDNDSNKLTVVNYNHEDIERTPDAEEFFLTIENTQFFEFVDSAYLFIGTNLGNIILVSKNTNNKVFFIKKFTLNYGSITKINYFNNEGLILSSEGGIIYYWKQDKVKKPSNNMFNFISNKKPIEVKIGEPINSFFSDDGEEMICITDYGNVFYANTKKSNEPKKLISSGNLRTKIIRLGFYKNEIFALGLDGLICIFGKENFTVIGYIKFENYIIRKFYVFGKFILIICDKVNDIFLYDIEKNCIVGKILSSFYYDNKNEDSIKDICIDETIENEFLVRTNKNRIFFFRFENIKEILFCYNEIFTENDLNIVSFQKFNDLFSLCLNDTAVYLYKIDLNNKKAKIDEEKKFDDFNIIESLIQEYINDSESVSFINDLKLRQQTVQTYEMPLTTQIKFSKQFKDIYYCFSEMFSILYIRNYIKHENIRSLNLNTFHPTTLSINLNEDNIYIGSKEGTSIIIKRTNMEIFEGFVIEFSEYHFDTVNDSIIIDNDAFSCSYNEVIKWGLI